MLPQFLNGFVLALNFAPGIARFVVELLSQIFGSVMDAALLPWLPTLILQLRQHQPILQPLIKEAAAVIPSSLDGFTGWQPAWLDMEPAQTPSQTESVSLTPELLPVRRQLFAAPEATNAVAAWLGISPQEWQADNA